VLGVGEHDDEGAEVDGERQSEVGGHSTTAVGRGENGFSFGPTVRRVDARGGGCMRRAWNGRGSRSIAPARGDGSGRAAVTHARRQFLGAV
jgi:hypothetical protein